MQNGITSHVVCLMEATHHAQQGARPIIDGVRDVLRAVYWHVTYVSDFCCLRFSRLSRRSLRSARFASRSAFVSFSLPFLS